MYDIGCREDRWALGPHPSPSIKDDSDLGEG